MSMTLLATVSDIEIQPDRVLLYREQPSTQPRYHIIAPAHVPFERGDLIFYQTFGENFGWFVALKHMYVHLARVQYELSEFQGMYLVRPAIMPDNFTAVMRDTIHRALCDLPGIDPKYRNVPTINLIQQLHTSSSD